MMLIKKILILLIIVFSCNLAKAEDKCQNLPSQILGVTTEFAEIEELPSLIKVLKRMKEEGVPTPTIRIVFQPEVSASKYKDAVQQMHGSKEKECQDRLAYVMGLLVDSSAMNEYNNKFNHKGKDIEKRAKKFADVLGDWVDIWEVGNELNGQWVGWKGDQDFENRTSTQLESMRKKIGKQIIGVYKKLKKHPKIIQNQAKFALNLYLFDDEKGKTCRIPFGNCDKACNDSYEMIEWANKYLSPQTNQLKFDYVFFSFYQDDCKVVQPTTDTWIYFFDKLTNIFKFDNKIPKVGLGEIGKQCKCLRQNGIDDDRCVCSEATCQAGSGGNCQTLQADYIKDYYQTIHGEIRDYLKNHPEKHIDYVGGFFYWTFYQDAVVDDTIADAILRSFISAAKTWK